MTLPHHAQHPETSYRQYLTRRRLELGERMASVVKVYLDTKFWLNFRDVLLGRKDDAAVKDLLALLRRLAKAKMVICPLSAEIFREVFAQSDINTLTATVELIDELSSGICVVETTECINLEVLHFLRQSLNGLDSVHPVEKLVWTKTAHVLGPANPVLLDVDDHTSAMVQKAFLDQLWTVSLTDFLSLMGDSESLGSKVEDLSEALTVGKFANMNDYRSFNDLFLIELRGILDVCESDFTKVPEQPGQAGGISRGRNVGKAIANVIHEAFRLGKVSRELPTLRIEATLHAGVRWDPKRKFKRTDCADFRHASAALPYCDYFLTERSLCHLVSDKVLGLGEHFACKIYSNAGSALKELVQLEI